MGRETPSPVGHRGAYSPERDPMTLGGVWGDKVRLSPTPPFTPKLLSGLRAAAWGRGVAPSSAPPSVPSDPETEAPPPRALRARCPLGEAGAGQGATRGSCRPLHWMDARRCLRGGNRGGHRWPSAATPPVPSRHRGGGSRRAVAPGGGRSCRSSDHQGLVAGALGQVPGARCSARRPRPLAPPPGRLAAPPPPAGSPGPRLQLRSASRGRVPASDGGAECG